MVLVSCKPINPIVLDGLIVIVMHFLQAGRKAAPGKFEAKRFCSEKRVITRCDGTYCCIFVVLYMKEPSHADPSAPLSRGRPPHVGYGVETDERGPGLPSRSSGP